MSKKNKKTIEFEYDSKIKSLHQVILKKALGYKIKETVEEFEVVDDEVKLKKKKVSVKYYPPDLNAVDIILNSNSKEFDFESYTDEELLAEKDNLVKKLKLFKTAEKELKVIKSDISDTK